MCAVLQEFGIAGDLPANLLTLRAYLALVARPAHRPTHMLTVILLRCRRCGIDCLLLLVYILSLFGFQLLGQHPITSIVDESPGSYELRSAGPASR